MNGEVDTGAPAQRLRRDVDLRGPHVTGQELVVREIGAHENQQVRVMDPVVRGPVPSSPVMPTSNGLSYWIHSLPRSV